MQKVCENLARVVGIKIAMLIKSDVQNTDTSGDIRPASLFALTLYRISIGRVRLEAVVLNNANLHLRYLKVEGVHKNIDMNKAFRWNSNSVVRVDI